MSYGAIKLSSAFSFEYLLKIQFAFIGVLLFLKLVYVVRNATKFRNFAQPPSNILFGNLFDLLPIFGDRSQSVRKTVDVYSHLFREKGIGVFWLSWFPLLACIDHVRTQEILSKPSILEKGFPFEYLRYFIGDGILCSAGEKWKERKKVVRPKFTANSVANFLPVVGKRTQVLLDRIGNISGELTDIGPLISSTSMEILTQISMGKELEESEILKLTRAVPIFIKNTLLRSLNPFLWPDLCYDGYARITGLKAMVDDVDTLLRTVIEERYQAKFQSGPDTSKLPESGYKADKDESILDYILDKFLMESGQKSLSEEVIRATAEEIKTLFIAGYDGPNNALVWFIYILGLHEDAQQKIFDEVSQLDEGQGLNTNQINQLTYTDQCAKEVLRLIPPAPFATRYFQKDESVGGKIIPKGTFMFFSIYSIHRDEAIFSEPEKFDPDRFSPSSVKMIPNSAYLPFGIRPRDCVGQRFAMLQMKAIAAMIVRKYHIKSNKPFEKIGKEIEFTLKPTEPLRVYFTPRNGT